MSNVTLGFQAVVQRMSDLFPEADGWTRLPNPYKPEENPDQFLRQGWGVALGPASNTNRLVNCKFSIERTLIITLARKFEGTENDDIGKANTELAIFEDQFAMIKELETDVSVNGNAMYTKYVTDGGIEYVRGNTDKFLMVRTEVTLEYLENFE